MKLVVLGQVGTCTPPNPKVFPGPTETRVDVVIGSCATVGVREFCAVAGDARSPIAIVNVVRPSNVPTVLL
jgi:hypothetical protein